MPHFICTTCGTQYADSHQPPSACTICEEPRQFVEGNRPELDHPRPPAADQPQLHQVQGAGAARHRRRAALRHRPASLVPQSPGGNILWDCLPLLDQAVVECLKALGGISAIAISHPHYYSSMVEWSRAFGGIPIYLHADDHQWVMRPDKDIIFWQGETNSLGDGLTLIRCGGHFDGGTVLHWAAGAEGRGASALRRHHPGRARPQARQLHVQLPELHPVGCLGHRERSSRPWSRSSLTASTGLSGTW